MKRGLLFIIILLSITSVTAETIIVSNDTTAAISIQFDGVTHEYEKTMTEGLYYPVFFKENRYSLFVRSIAENEANFVVTNRRQKIYKIALGERQDIDLDRDGTSDIFLSVDDIIRAYKVTVTINDLFENTSDEPTTNTLGCANQETQRERIQCRVQLQKMERENARLNFLPEECLTSSSRESCITRHKNMQPCYRENLNSERVRCVQNQLNFRGISEERRTCNLLSGDEKNTCLNTLRENAFIIMKFRFDNLIERAIYLQREGLVSEEESISFIDAVETKKQEFNAADIAQKKEIVKEVKELWKEFIFLTTKVQSS